jgi:murein DD-endopeptidase MepM/ murein hydrolase activator NlpD
MTLPFESGIRVTSPFGARRDPFTGALSEHTGIDLVPLREGDLAVRAAVSGSVLQSRMVTDPMNRTSEWGNYVSLLGDDGRVYYHCHLASRAVSQGERVAEGQALGVAGQTGRATGVHLHFEIREGGVPIDPSVPLGVGNIAGAEKSPAPRMWYDEAAAWAVDNGILCGTGDGLALDEPCTRGMTVVFLHRLWDLLHRTP